MRARRGACSRSSSNPTRAPEAAATGTPPQRDGGKAGGGPRAKTRTGTSRRTGPTPGPPPRSGGGTGGRTIPGREDAQPKQAANLPSGASRTAAEASEGRRRPYLIYGQNVVKQMTMYTIPGVHVDPQQTRHTCRIKRYPDGSVSITAANRAVFREPGWEPETAPPGRDLYENVPEDLRQLWADEAAYRILEDGHTPEEQQGAAAPEQAGGRPTDDRGRRRAASALRDLALSNDWRWFVTLTLNGDLIDRYDYQAVMKKLRTWLDNQVRRHGLRYVLVAEHHKDQAIHFHGFFPGGASGCMCMVDSGTLDVPGSKKPRKPRSQRQREAWLQAGAHPVFNCPAWPWGFSTAIPLYGRKEAAVAYVAKYVTKGTSKVGGRWYYHGGHLAGPEIEYADMDPADLGEHPGIGEYDVPAAGLHLRFAWYGADDQTGTKCDGCQRGECLGCCEEVRHA